MVAKNCEQPATVAMALFPIKGARAHQGLPNAGARRSLPAVTGSYDFGGRIAILKFPFRKN